MSILQNSNAISAGGYSVDNSLRFRASASAYLSRTPASAGSRTTWTWSAWVKRGALGSPTKELFTASTGGEIFFGTGDTLTIYDNATTYLTTTQVFRDPSAWYHIVIVWDTTQATSSNRIKMYVNGSQVTAFSTSSYPAQNTTSSFNNNTLHNIGEYFGGGSYYFDGYQTETRFIDGQALTPSSFGETDATTGVWKPKKYTGTYGTNGFYLKFSDIATTSGSNAGLGKDFSGNTNYWTTNNISVTSGTTYDAMIDSPTNASSGTQPVGNYAVWNPLAKSSNITLSNANLSASNSASDAKVLSTIGMSSGKWYCEVTAGSIDCFIGICTASASLSTSVGYDATSWGYWGGTPSGKYTNSARVSAYGASYTTNDVIGIAFDADAGDLTFYKNGVSQGTAFTGLTSGPYFFAVGNGNTSYPNVNFGSRPFAYTPPTGYKALCTTNLPTPTILQGNKYMDATLYTGTGTTNVIVNQGQFKPDFVWGKSRSAATENAVYDSVRGTGLYLITNNTDAQASAGTAGLNSFNSNGFSLGSGTGLNANGATYVGWQWQAGQGSTSSNTSGSITSTVSVNTTAGFSVVTYTGTGANATVGHGLGVAPKMIITKRRNVSQSWGVYHVSLGAANAVYLNLTNASAATTNWNSTTPTSSVFSVGNANESNASTGTYVAYCFAAISGYSAFGSYTGNGSTDGPFVFTNLKPKFIMIKRTDTTSNWTIVDTAREGYNVDNDPLYPNLLDAEGTADLVDILSNGFKLRSTDASVNANTGTYIYACFASDPLASNNRAR